jgi:putative ABC transport system permease protein
MSWLAPNFVPPSPTPERRALGAAGDWWRLPRLAWCYLWSQPLATVLNGLLLALGLATIGFVWQAQHTVEHALTRDLAAVDLVVGAKGSPLQLILAGVWHLDAPTGNVPLAEVEALARLPQVAEVVPLSLGDNLAGYRIVGTTAAYPALYGARLARGRWWGEPMQAVLGAQVARATGLDVDATFAGAHGLGRGGTPHGHATYRVTGVLAPCGCVLDRLVLTATESVWQVHEAAHGTAGDHGEARAGREVTLALVRYASPLAAITLPRHINATTAMQAAVPAQEVTRLLAMLGVGARVLQGVGAVLLAVAGLSVFVALWNAVRARAADLAVWRLLGASPARVATLLVCEALWLALLAALAGVVGVVALGKWLAHRLAGDLSGVAAVLAPVPLVALPALSVLVALLAGAWPVVAAYRHDVRRHLH